MMLCLDSTQEQAKLKEGKQKSRHVIQVKLRLAQIPLYDI